MSKYYTPEIEEFHEGFEFEYQETDAAQWVDAIYKIGWTGDLLNIIDHMFYSGVRVKHLDREDIESLGFVKSGLAKDVFISKERHDIQGIGENYVIGINFKKELNYMQVFYTSNETNTVGAIFFAGKLKNKSELKRILKQIGV